MKTSARLAVLKQFCDYLGTEVTTANGYSHTLTNAVFRGRFFIGKDDPLPMITILENPHADRNPEEAGWFKNQQTDHWVLLVMGWVADDYDHPTDPAHALMADVKAAFGKFRELWGDQQLSNTPVATFLADLAIEPGVVRPPDELSAKAYFWMRLVFKIVEDVDAPFWVT